MKEAERTLPSDLDSERSVLGAILVWNAAFEQVAPVLTPHDFFRDAHRRIFAAMTDLLDARGVVDDVTLKDALARRGDLDEVGGPVYLASLSNGVPRATNVEFYARIVKEKAQLRGLIDAANRTLAGAYAAEEPSSELLRRADVSLLALSNGHAGRMADLRDAPARLFKDIEYQVEHRGELTGVVTGFKQIDDITLGWQPGDLNIIAARPSIGKTTWAMNSVVAAARAGKRVAVFSLEMRRKQLENRLMSNLSGVSLERIRGGFLGSEDYQRVSQGLNEMHTLAIHIDDRSGQSVWDIRGGCRRLKAEGGLDLVMIDYVQLMAGSLEGREAFNRNAVITDISRRLKGLADELSAPILLLSQLSRAGSKRFDPRPQLSDLRESGALEQDADIVLFLHRKNHKVGGVTQVILEKHRNGRTGTVNATFDMDTSTFTDGGDDPPEPEKPARKPSTRRRGAIDEQGMVG